MLTKIFISYRRDDVAGDARGIREGLAIKFGKPNVFMDVDNLLAGQRFDEQLAKALDACDVLIVVIGPRWMDLLKERIERRERDYVREEVAEALRCQIVVIPVRVGREGQMPALPRREELPEDIGDLVLYQKHDVAHERFGRDLADLTQAIANVRAARAKPGARSHVGWTRVGAFAAGVIALIWAGVYFAWEREMRRQTRPTVEEAQRKQVVIAPQPPKSALLCPIEILVGKEKRCLRPGWGKTEWFRDCPACPEMVVVPFGSFIMGSPASEEARNGAEGPQHRVTFAQPFAVGRFVVTFDEWDACVAAGGCNGYRASDRGWGRGLLPAINVSWHDAKAYVSWLSTATGNAYRLLTEAEWEYAARAGSTTSFWWGSSISHSQANYDATATKPEYRPTPVPVDSFAANPWGLYSVHGNVWQWVEDCWNDGYWGAPTDGSAWITGDCGKRVLRGGSGFDAPQSLRAAGRGRDSSDVRYFFSGFRVARTLSP